MTPSPRECSTMARNPILEELYAARAEILKEYGGDLTAYIRDSAKRAKASGHPFAKIKQRFIRRNGV